MSAQMQQHKAQVRKTMRQASSENTFALEELAEELKDAKNCLTRDAASRQGAARFPNKICGGRGAPVIIRRRRAGERSERPHEFSADASNLAADLAEAKARSGGPSAPRRRVA